MACVHLSDVDMMEHYVCECVLAGDIVSDVCGKSSGLI